MAFDKYLFAFIETIVGLIGLGYGTITLFFSSISFALKVPIGDFYIVILGLGLGIILTAHGSYTMMKEIINNPRNEHKRKK